MNWEAFCTEIGRAASQTQPRYTGSTLDVLDALDRPSTRQELAHRTGYSVYTVRQALELLEGERMVEVVGKQRNGNRGNSAPVYRRRS